MTSADYSNLQVNAERLQADFNELSEIGATINGGISRLALSNEDLRARAWLDRRLQQAGLRVQDDDAGNLSGVLPSSAANAKTLLLGSHLDSVPDGGRYDGTIGVLAALECLRTIQEAGLSLPNHLEAINFTDEEGTWQAQLGSRVLTGILKEDFYIDRDYGPFRAALLRAGIPHKNIYKAKRDPATLLGYLELHIEQSDRLCVAGCDVGVVTNIAGCAIYQMSFHGEASHGGTTAMENRKDALLATAAYVVAAHRTVREQFPEGIFHCKNFTASTSTYNTIPEDAQIVWECRHTDKDGMAELEYQLIQLARETESEHKLQMSIKRLVETSAATMAGRSVLAVEQVCRQLGVRSLRLTSYAGHDAQIMSAFTPSGMIFIPSVNGISHSPKEFTEWSQVVRGANVLLHTALLLAANTE